MQLHYDLAIRKSMSCVGFCSSKDYETTMAHNLVEKDIVNIRQQSI